MRNAAAHFDDDFALDKPARKKAPRRSGSKKKGKSRFRFRVDPKKVTRYGAIALCSGVVLGIMVNALVLQKGRHPAPLFGKSITLGDASPPRPAPVKKAVAETPPVSAIPIPRPTPAPSAKPSDDEKPSSDAIGRLIQGAPAPIERSDAKTVTGVQRALIKLGYSVKTTGTLGPQTKKALEAFEKERHLPVSGELSRRVVKILAAESGLKIEH